MNKIILTILMVVMFSLTGCASYMSYKASEKELVGQKVMASGNDSAIKALRMGDDSVGIGINVLAIDTLKEHPWRQLGAAILDVGLVYAAREGVDALSNSGDGSSSSADTTIEVSGDNNSVSITTATDSYNNDTVNDYDQSQNDYETNPTP
jgi:hypothetical protein